MSCNEHREVNHSKRNSPRRRLNINVSEESIGNNNNSRHSSASLSENASIQENHSTQPLQALSTTSSNGWKKKHRRSMSMGHSLIQIDGPKQIRKSSQRRRLSVGCNTLDRELLLSPHRAISYARKSHTLSQDELAMKKPEMKDFNASSECNTDVSSFSVTQSQIVHKAFKIFDELTGSGEAVGFQRFEKAIAIASYACFLCATGADLTGFILRLHQDNFTMKTIAVQSAFESTQRDFHEVAVNVKRCLDSLQQQHTGGSVVFLVGGGRAPPSWYSYVATRGQAGICVCALLEEHVLVYS